MAAPWPCCVVPKFRNQSPLWSIQVEQFIDVFEASGGQAALEGGNSYPHTVAANTIA
jgi:hypothetical protein